MEETRITIYDFQWDYQYPMPFSRIHQQGVTKCDNRSHHIAAMDDC